MLVDVVALFHSVGRVVFVVVVVTVCIAVQHTVVVLGVVVAVLRA